MVAKAVKHTLKTYTTTIWQAGAHVTTGRCTCGWNTEVTYVYEAKQAHAKHVREARAKEEQGKVG